MHDDLRMPFGQHKGQPLRAVPVEYLDWLIGAEFFQATRWDPFREQITAHLKGRPEWQALGPDKPAAAEDDGEYVDWKSPDFLK